MAVGQSGIAGVTIRGAVGNVVFQRFGDGVTVRERVRPRDPRTPGQMASRAAMAAVSRAWGRLSQEDFGAWEAFGKAGGTAGYPAYVSLTRKWLAVHGGGTPPTAPPAGPFFGDALTLIVGVGDSPSPDGSFGEGGSLRASEACGRARGERSGTLPPLPLSTWEATPTDSDTKAFASPPSADPPSQDEPLEEGALTLTASQPNAQGVVTEVLTQPLANARRKPRERDWKTAAFVAFAAGSLTRTLALPTGAYAVAYRFVNAATGQATAMAFLGSVALG